ncbi:MAG: hypothetical protein MN733_40345, partial [Nitrososphaera sp.]|nr:hypothetical protein [Nitrososphaera sp.]
LPCFPPDESLSKSFILRRVESTIIDINRHLEEIMRDLKTLREGWHEIESFESELLRNITIQEKVQDYLDLLDEFGEWDEATETHYQAEREEALLEIQRRLVRLEQYRLTHAIFD